jgi:hypothetical protein
MIRDQQSFPGSPEGNAKGFGRRCQAGVHCAMMPWKIGLTAAYAISIHP